MELKQQLVFCKQCEKRAFSDIGIICSLTKRKPAFQNSCNDFSIDSKEAQRIASKANDNQKSDNNSIWIYIGIGLIVIRIIIRLIRN